MTLQRITFTSASFWTIQGLEISPETQSPFERITIVKISGGSDNIVEDCLIYTAVDTTAWATTDWNSRSCHGITVSGSRHTIRNNRLRNINHGITINTSATDCLVERNTIDGFAGDGLRGLGDFCRFEGNTVKNSYDVSGNHDDGFRVLVSRRRRPGDGNGSRRRPSR